ncbi:MAG: acyl carrier protein [Opitutaceae bacterium]|nr:acyl carrier protein [Opitutaceae bacterium]
MPLAPTLQRLVHVVSDSLPEGLDACSITPDTPLSSFGVDSLMLIDLIFDLEQEFGVKLAAEEMTALKTVGELAAHLDRRAAGA